MTRVPEGDEVLEKEHPTLSAVTRFPVAGFAGHRPSVIVRSDDIYPTLSCWIELNLYILLGSAVLFSGKPLAVYWKS